MTTVTSIQKPTYQGIIAVRTHPVYFCQQVGIPASTIYDALFPNGDGNVERWIGETRDTYQFRVNMDFFTPSFSNEIYIDVAMAIMLVACFSDIRGLNPLYDELCNSFIRHS